MKVTMKVNNCLKTMVISSPNQFWFLSFVYAGYAPCSSLTFNPFTPKIPSVILLTVYHTVPVMLVWRIWYWINL